MNKPTSKRALATEEPLILLHPLNAKVLLTFSAFIASLLFLLRWQIFPVIASQIIGGTGGDAGLYQFLARSNNRDLFSLPWFSTSAFYPYSGTLAWSDNFILPSLAIGALLKLGASFAASFNIVILGAQFLNGFCTALMTYSLGGRKLLAIFAGSAFMCAPYFTIHLAHSQLQFAFFIPLILHLFFLATHGKIIRNGVLIGLALCASFLCSVYYTVFAALVLGCTLLTLALLRPRMFTLPALSMLSAAIFAGALPLIPFVLPYFDVKEVFNERQLYEAYYFSASGLSYLSSGVGKLLFSGAPFHGPDEANLFPGIVLLGCTILTFARLFAAKQFRVPFALYLVSLLTLLIFSSSPTFLAKSSSLIIASLAAWLTLFSVLFLVYRLGSLEEKLGFKIITDRDLLALFVTIATLFLLLSLGPLGNPEKGHFVFSPYRCIYAIIPGVDAVRAVSRYGIVVTFCLAGAAALVLSKRYKENSLPLMTSLLLCVVFAESYYPSFLIEPEPRRSDLFSTLKSRIGEGEAFAVLPYAPSLDQNKNIDSWSRFASAQVISMNWAFGIGKPFINGYSGIKSKYMRELPRELANFPDKRSIIALRRIAGLKYILFTPALAEQYDPFKFKEALKSVEKELKQIANDSEGAMLFELSGEIPLTAVNTIDLPSSSPGELEISFAATKTVLPLQIYIDSIMPGAPFSKCEIGSNGVPCTIAIPASNENVRPLQVRVEGANISSINLTGSRWTPAR